MPYVGTIVFDVKSKTPYEGGFLFDVAEVRRLEHFDDLFRITTFFACLDPDGGRQSVGFRVAELMHCPVHKVKGKLALPCRSRQVCGWIWGGLFKTPFETPYPCTKGKGGERAPHIAP